MRAGLLALLVAAFLPAVAVAETSVPATTGAVQGGQPADAAARTGAVPSKNPGIATRSNPERRRCRDESNKLRLFGLARHKYIQRCRAARRRSGEPSAPPPPK